MSSLYNLRPSLAWSLSDVLADALLPAEDTTVYSLFHLTSTRWATQGMAENVVLAIDSFSDSSKADSVRFLQKQTNKSP